MGTARRKRSTAAEVLVVRLFGGAGFALGQTPWRFAAPPRTLPLLAYLILKRQKPVPRDVTAFTLWPDDDEVTARANLRRHLHYLRSALPPTPTNRPWVVIQGRSTLQWSSDAPCSIDVADFERLSSDEASLEAADLLYAGDLLPGIGDEWILAERERLREQALVNLAKLIAMARRDGDLPAALRFAQRLLIFDPWREHAIRQSMELRYALGDRAGAVAQFEIFASRLRRDLSADPMPETIACYESLLRDAPVLEPALKDRAAIEGEAPRLRLPFVGREAELAQLRAWWTNAARGNGTLGLIGAEAGAGKTRLLFEFKSLVESEGGRVLAGATASLESLPYQAVLDALSGAAPIISGLPVDGVWIAVLSELLPDLATRQPAVEAPQISVDQVRTRLFEAFFAVLKALALQRPTLLVVEDIHWAGDATIDLLEHLSRRIADSRLLIVASYREEEVPRSHPLRRLRRRGTPGRSIAPIALGPITPGDVATLVTKFLRRLPADPQWPQLL